MGRVGLLGQGQGQHLSRVGLLQLLLVLFHLLLMLGPQLLQGICQPALKLELFPIINLHQPGLMAAFGLTQLLEGLDAETKIRTRSLRLRPKWPSSLPSSKPVSHCQPHFNLGARCWPPLHPVFTSARQAGGPCTQLMLQPQLWCLSLPALVLLPAEHNAHLTVDVLLEVQLLLQGLQPVLSIYPPQHLILKLLLGLT